MSYKRILLKISGEILAGKNGEMFDTTLMERLAREIKQLIDTQIEVMVVVGAGNIVRGAQLANHAFDRVNGDYMGMLATIINGLALQDVFERNDLKTRVMSAIEAQEIVEPFIRRRATRHAEKGRVVILVGGTGNPYFTTDTAAALRAMEIGADVVMKATKVDGVYDKDPKKHADAVKFEQLSYIDVLNKGLNVMDSTAISLCMDNKLPILTFNLNDPVNILRAVRGEKIGTLIK